MNPNWGVRQALGHCLYCEGATVPLATFHDCCLCVGPWAVTQTNNMWRWFLLKSPSTGSWWQRWSCIRYIYTCVCVGGESWWNRVLITEKTSTGSWCSCELDLNNVLVDPTGLITWSGGGATFCDVERQGLVKQLFQVSQAPDLIQSLQTEVRRFCFTVELTGPSFLVFVEPVLLAQVHPSPGLLHLN